MHMDLVKREIVRQIESQFFDCLMLLMIRTNHSMNDNNECIIEYRVAECVAILAAFATILLLTI